MVRSRSRWRHGVHRTRKSGWWSLHLQDIVFLSAFVVTLTGGTSKTTHHGHHLEKHEECHEHQGQGSNQQHGPVIVTLAVESNFRDLYHITIRTHDVPTFLDQVVIVVFPVLDFVQQSTGTRSSLKQNKRRKQPHTGGSTSIKRTHTDARRQVDDNENEQSQGSETESKGHRMQVVFHRMTLIFIVEIERGDRECRCVSFIRHVGHIGAHSLTTTESQVSWHANQNRHVQLGTVEVGFVLEEFANRQHAEARHGSCR
mmetsp:Transcript_3266/g.6248  ORF Transcript_3266/g.6248 Transcript_3266/m.6248 type:complete len:257 (-) Transcript_3266:164-934(-)